MWETFSDYELADLARFYGISEMLCFNERLELDNRSDIERMLTEIEYDAAFPQESLDFQPEVEYN